MTFRRAHFNFAVKATQITYSHILDVEVVVITYF